MSESLLQTYLTSQHIKITDENGVENLKSAVGEVKKLLEKKKSKIITYTLVGLDPQVKDNDPIVEEVENIIIKKWSTFKNSVTATNDKSTTYIRAVILEALSQLAKSSEINATLIWHTSRDIVSYYKLGKESEQIRAFLQVVANKVEQIARKNWGVVNQLTNNEFQGIEIAIIAPPVVHLNAEELTTQIKSAFVFNGWSANAGAGENPYQHGVNNWHWPKFAAERAAKGISEEVNKALTQQSKSLVTITSSIKKGLDEYFDGLTPFFEQLSNSFTTSVLANNKRSELLWWKQTLYSPGLNQSYRNYTAIELAVLMASDLSGMVDGIYPVSVDFLLKETLRDIYNDEINRTVSFGEIVNSFIKMNDEIQNLIHEFAKEEKGRKPFLNGLANALKLSSDKEFSTDTGIDLDSQISIADLTVWLFHCLQAEKLSITK